MGVLSYQLITEQTDHLQGESSAPHGPRAISSQPPPSHALPVYTHWSEPQLSPPRWVVPLPPYQDARVRGERVVNPHRACHIAGPSHPDSGLSTGGAGGSLSSFPMPLTTVHLGSSQHSYLLMAVEEMRRRLALSTARDHSRYGYGGRFADSRVVSRNQFHKMHLSEVQTLGISSVNLFFDSIQ